MALHAVAALRRSRRRHDPGDRRRGDRLDRRRARSSSARRPARVPSSCSRPPPTAVRSRSSARASRSTRCASTGAPHTRGSIPSAASTRRSNWRTRCSRSPRWRDPALGTTVTPTVRRGHDHSTRFPPRARSSSTCAPARSRSRSASTPRCTRSCRCSRAPSSRSTAGINRPPLEAARIRRALRTRAGDRRAPRPRAARRCRRRRCERRQLHGGHRRADPRRPRRRRRGSPRRRRARRRRRDRASHRAAGCAHRRSTRPGGDHDRNRSLRRRRRGGLLGGCRGRRGRGRRARGRGHRRPQRRGALLSDIWGAHGQPARARPSCCAPSARRATTSAARSTATRARRGDHRLPLDARRSSRCTATSRGSHRGLVGRSVGFAMKLHQRAWALDRGIDASSSGPSIRSSPATRTSTSASWAPMPVEYLTNFYGVMSRRDQRRRRDRPAARAVDAAGSRGRSRRPRTAASRRSTTGLPGRTTVAVPADIEAMRVDEPGLAHEWRVRRARAAHRPARHRRHGSSASTGVQGYVVQMGAAEVMR